MTTKIRLLPPTTINRIAAGEVVERPASVIKELIENSLDAGATQIDIHLEGGGKRLIAVRDNGCGMSKQELSLAILRHATSKLPDDDLLHITQLGFRGEALPSIGSVSRLTLSSRTANADSGLSDSGWAIHIEGGAASEPMPAALEKGTLVEVRDLFFATPARLGFLKSERSENEAVQDMVERLAMTRADIGFNLNIDGKRKLALNAEPILARLARLLGKQFTDNALSLEYMRDNNRLYGFCALPTYNRGTSAFQYLFVNGRAVKDRLLLGCLRAAYQDFLARDRHPVVALYLDLPPEEVDVNVHPAKTEVRFRDAAGVRSLLIGGLRNALQANAHRASTTVADSALAAAQVSSLSRRAYNYAPSPQASNSLREHAFAFQHKLDIVAPVQAREPEQSRENVSSEIVEPSPDYPLGAASAQLHSTYIISQTNDGIVIVDQHAAHERLVYEALKKGFENNNLPRQMLLIPEIVELEEKSVRALLDYQEDLAKLGLIIEDFGGNTIVVREIPALLGEVNTHNLLRNLADDVSEYGGIISLKEKLEEICASIACHGSVRAGRKLQIAEMNALLRQMEATPHSGQCNHGRPTYVELKLKDIEKLFGRI